MGQRCVHYTERDNGTRVLYAPNQYYSFLDKEVILKWGQLLKGNNNVPSRANSIRVDPAEKGGKYANELMMSPENIHICLK